jgi:hypothetical protein
VTNGFKGFVVGFTIQQFVALRPYVYHLTARANRARIKRTDALDPAAAILKASGNAGMLSMRRATGLQAKINGDVIHVRDQHPLHAGNVAFQGKWTIDKLVEEINERVFFWPGSASWVVSYARRHFHRYAAEKPIVLRMQFASLLSANVGRDPLFCKYNSGSPRWVSGKASPRGPSTFEKCGKAPFLPSGVVEVTFRSSVRLPADVEVADSYDGLWRRL